jgi:hypothetical protein
VTYPTFEEIYSGANPDRLFVTKRSLLSLLPRCLLFLLLALIVAYVNISVATVETGGYFRWLGLVPLVVLLDLIRVHYNDIYVFSRFKLTKIEGRISFNYSVPSINYNDIRGLVVSQSFMGRILGYGDIQIGTASTEGHELVMEGMLDPERLGEIIEKFRQNSQGSSGGD